MKTRLVKMSPSEVENKYHKTMTAHQWKQVRLAKKSGVNLEAEVWMFANEPRLLIDLFVLKSNKV